MLSSQTAFEYMSQLDDVNTGTYSELLGAGSDTCPVVLEEVLRTLLDTGGAVRVLPLGVPFPPEAELHYNKII